MMTLHDVYNYAYHTPPYAHQRQIIETSIDAPAYLFAMDMGTGKSKTALDQCRYHWQHRHINAVLIVAPKGMYHQWGQADPNECSKHWPESDDPDKFIRYTWSHAKTKFNDTARLEMLQPSERCKICVINTEALSTSTGAAFALRFVQRHQCYLIFDEASLIRNHQSRRAKTAAKLGQHAKYRRALTGSPVSNSPLDIFGIFQFLDPGILGPSYYAFRNRYAVLQTQYMGQRSFQAVVGYKNVADLHRLIEPFTARVTKHECLDLPPLTHETRHIELSAEQKRLYTLVRTELIAELEGLDVVTAVNALAGIIRLRQILAGFVASENLATGARAIRDLPNNRIDGVVSLCREMQGKVIIWCHFQKTVIQVAEALTKEFGAHSVITYFGKSTLPEAATLWDADIARADKQALINAPLSNDSTHRFFVATPSTGKYGLNLTRPNHMIFATHDYDLDARLQAEARMERIGQENPMLCVNLVARDTLDEKILQALRQKKSMADLVTGDAWREWI